MSSDLWIGAITTLSGATLGGAISRQQLKAAHAQRAEDAEQDKHRRSIERRFSAYADFLDKARSFRNALRPYGYQPVPLLAPKDISALARSAHAASPLAFLVVESRRTRVALGELVRVMSDIQGVLDDERSDPADKPWLDLNKRIKPALDKHLHCLAIGLEHGYAAVLSSAALAYSSGRGGG